MEGGNGQISKLIQPKIRMQRDIKTYKSIKSSIKLEIQYIILRYLDITPERAENWFLSPVSVLSESFSCLSTSFFLLALSFVSLGEDGEKHGQQNGGIF